MKKKKGFITWLVLLSIVIVLAMLCLFDPVAETVGKWTGVAADKIKTTAKTVVGAAIGLLLISYGVAALAVPILGGALIVIGVALLAYSLWPLFTSSSSSSVEKTGLQKVA
jgi:hypothetical protein